MDNANDLQSRLNAQPIATPADPFEEPERLSEIRHAIAALCADFPDSYWRGLDEQRTYPEAFVRRLTETQWLSALIPEEYGGLGLGITEAAVILQEINHQGGNAGPAHAHKCT